MNSRSRFLALIIVCVTSLASAQDSFFGELSEAMQGGIPWPLLTDYQADADIDAAYGFQSRFIGGLHEPTIGFKAGLTSRPSQARFGATGAVAGVLIKGMAIEGHVVSLEEYSQLMIETEVGFVLCRDIDAPIASVEEAKRVVEAMVAVIELPDLGFSDNARLNVASIVAANVSARKILIGAQLDMEDANDVSVRLSHDGAVVSEGRGQDAMGDQYQALMWLVNRSLLSGYKVRKGHLLITGALGKMIPGAPGNYVAEYAGHETVTFEVR